MIAAATRVPARGRDRRRPARAGGGQRPARARHGRDRGAPDAVADGAPARPHRRPTCCRSRWRPRGLKFLLEAQTEALAGRRRAGRVRRGAARRRRDAAGRPGRDGGRHPAQHRARRVGRAALQPRHRGQRHDADLRPAHLRGRRVRRAIAAPPTAWSRRCSRWPRSAPTIWRSSASAATPGSSPRPSSRSPASTCSPPATSRGGEGTEEIVLSDPGGGVYKKLVHQGRQAGRRRAVRRHRRRRLVLPAAARGPQRRATSATT